MLKYLQFKAFFTLQIDHSGLWDKNTLFTTLPVGSLNGLKLQKFNLTE